MFFMNTSFMRFRSLSILLIVACLMEIAACQKKAAVSNQESPDAVPARFAVNPMIAEASGITDSKRNTGYLWVEEDSGNPTQLYLLSHDGSVLKKVFIKGSTNRDWEDMALSDGKIYIAETGDNSLAYSNYAFYIFSEPDKTVDTVSNFEKISFQYADGPHDAEAFLVEPTSKNIYVITKNDSLSEIYKLSAPLSSSSIQTAKFIGKLKISGVTSACISLNGKEIILKTYTSLLYYRLNERETIESILKKDAVKIPYTIEPQGEAVTFAADNSGYFTLSEKGLASSQYLYFYKKN